MSDVTEPKPPGRGRGQRHTKEANASEDAWKAAVSADLDDIEARLDALEEAAGTAGGMSDGGDTGTTGGTV
jgi:hypothetical protein